MGNLPSASFDGSCQVLATVAMSKYMSLSKPQVLAIRDQAMLFPSNMKLTELHRSSLNAILNHAKVLPYPDQDIINLLFTLWISNGYENQVDCIDLCIGMSILACPNESFEKILNFALVVLDAKNSKMISVKDATRLSQCKCFHNNNKKLYTYTKTDHDIMETLTYRPTYFWIFILSENFPETISRYEYNGNISWG